MLNNPTHIIIQAGGRGTRLEWLTRNKPKCLVPVNNIPLIFHTLKKYPQTEFIIIADYKADVLEKYLETFASEYKYKIIKAKNEGTISGLNEAIEYLSNDEPVIITWCDIILADCFNFPATDENYIGISNSFECRWSFIDNEFIKKNSKENGVAGVFVFKNKNVLKNMPNEGALVPWLKNQNISFKKLILNGAKEIGTMLTYSELEDNKLRCRPFNKIQIDGNTVIKTGINDLGKKISKDEVGWYKHLKTLNFENIPEIYDYEPLKMKLVTGKNIYEYDCLTKTQKQDVLKKIIDALNKLHYIEDAKPSVIEDAENIYFNKTFDRLDKIKKLVPFSDKEFIKINGRYYKNVLFNKEELKQALTDYYPKEFRLIHGDCTFSNLMFDTFNMKAVLIDPRGYFGNTKLYGDTDYDWAKLYYSIKGEYDQFNKKKFSLDIKKDDVELAIKPNNWADMEDYFFDCLPNINKNKIKLLHAIIWLSLTSYAWEDYDSICGAFYNGIAKLGEVL